MSIKQTEGINSIINEYHNLAVLLDLGIYEISIQC